MPWNIKKIFTITSNGKDIFQYHSELQQQIKLVRMQGETLGLEAVIMPWIERYLLLIAAWQNPHYRKIALDFTLDGKTVSVEALVTELQKQQLLTAHLNQTQTGRDRDPDRPRRDGTRVHNATATPGAPPRMPCFNFAKGDCSRGATCPYTHAISEEKKFSSLLPKPNTPKPKPKANQALSTKSQKKGTFKKDSSKKKSVGRRCGVSFSKKECKRCGSKEHSFLECKFDGKCDYCDKQGHKYSVCMKRLSEKGQSKQAVTEEPEEVSIRAASIAPIEHRQLTAFEEFSQSPDRPLTA